MTAAFSTSNKSVKGNLSSDRVSKRDVFELFHPYGRLAQISIKSAYGFVQYHTLAEAEAAMHHLQNAEIKGRKIRKFFFRGILMIAACTTDCGHGDTNKI